MCKCTFNKAWIGVCGVENCEEHKNLVCASCGKPATHNCDQTMGPMVCGENLCNDCEHTLTDNGCNSGGDLPEGYKSHCKKGEQVNTPWYTWTNEELANNEKVMKHRHAMRKQARIDFKDNVAPTSEDKHYMSEYKWQELLLGVNPQYREKMEE